MSPAYSAPFLPCTAWRFHWPQKRMFRRCSMMSCKPLSEQTGQKRAIWKVRKSHFLLLSSLPSIKSSKCYLCYLPLHWQYSQGKSNVLFLLSGTTIWIPHGKETMDFDRRQVYSIPVQQATRHLRPFPWSIMAVSCTPVLLNVLRLAFYLARKVHWFWNL